MQHVLDTRVELTPPLCAHGTTYTPRAQALRGSPVPVAVTAGRLKFAGGNVARHAQCSMA